MNTIKNDDVVEIKYTLKNDGGEILDDSKKSGPLSFIQGRKNIIPGLESELYNKNVGDSFKVSVAPEDAYGLRSESFVQTVTKSQLGESAENVKVGDRFQAQGHNGEPIVMAVTMVSDNEVTLDGNHPLAGETLHFDIEVVGVREATEKEIERGNLYEESGSCEKKGCCD